MVLYLTALIWQFKRRERIFGRRQFKLRLETVFLVALRMLSDEGIQTAILNLGFSVADPALKRWFILGCPAGANSALKVKKQL